jgi:regulator of sigma E protease
VTLLAFLFAIGLLVTVHEWGHYRVAVACGVKVHTFSIGFGPTLFKWRSKQPRPGQDTEFQISLFPLGGYVRMADEREAEVAAADLPMAFNRQPLRARAAIVAAGPLANLFLAVLLFTGMNWVGRYETAPIMSTPVADSAAHRAGLRSGDVVLRAGLTPADFTHVESLEMLRAWIAKQRTSPICLEVKSKDEQMLRVLRLDAPPMQPPQQETDGWFSRGFVAGWSKPLIGSVVAGEPASQAGLQPGDLVSKVDGVWVEDAAQLRALIRLSGQGQVPMEQVWDIWRGDQLLQLFVTPTRVQEGTAWFGRVGAQIGQPAERVWIQYGAMDALSHSLLQTWQHVDATVETLQHLFLGAASWDQLGGPLMIADYAGRTAQMGLGVYLGYLAMLSVSLCVFNLLPLPVLDGGHLLYYLYEFVTGKSPSDSWLGVMQRLGLALLLTLTIFSFLNDAGRLGWLG